MESDRELLRRKLDAWEAALTGYSLPAWDAFPALPLYMDQVIYLLNGYLSPLPQGEKEEAPLTPAMINNYVKLKIIPPPVKKRYSREHLAYLIMVCVLKQSMSTGHIRRLLPPDLPSDAVRALYDAFARTVRSEQERFCDTARRAAQPVLAEDGPPVAHLAFQAAVASALFRMMTRQLATLGEEAQPAPISDG